MKGVLVVGARTALTGLVGLAALAAGCDSLPRQPYALTILPRNADGEYQPIEAGAPLDIVVGYQFYKSARVKVEAPTEAPARLDLDFVLSIDGMPDYAENSLDIPTHPVNGRRLSDRFYLLFNHIDVLADVIGRSAHIAFTTRSQPPGTGAIDVVLTNRPGCIEQQDGSVICT